MSKQINDSHYVASFGFPRADLMEAIENIEKIKTTYDVLSQRDERRIFSKLPFTVASQAMEAFSTSKQGLLIEQYYAWNRQERLTVAHEDHKGDATDGKRHEIKSSRITHQGAAQFAGIRPSDEVDFFHFVVHHGDKLVAYVVPSSKLGLLSMCQSRNTHDKVLQFRVGGPAHSHLEQIASSVEVLDDSTTGNRWDALRFVDETGLTVDDFSRLSEVREGVRRAVQGTNTTAHLTLDELLDVRPLIRECKFGNMIQDWGNDHLEVATTRTPGIGDGVGRKGRIEWKYASVGSRGGFQIHGIKPDELDELYIALRTGHEIEFFKLNQKSVRAFVRNYNGTETNNGVYKMSFGQSHSKAVKFLRRRKAVDLKVHMH